VTFCALGLCNVRCLLSTTLRGYTRGCSYKVREAELASCKSREKNIGLRGAWLVTAWMTAGFTGRSWARWAAETRGQRSASKSVAVKADFAIVDVGDHNASSWLLVVFTVPVSEMVWAGDGGSVFLFCSILQRRSPSFRLFVQLLLSLFQLVCRVSWASWRGGPRSITKYVLDSE
jgi:hypothetical protein